MDTETGDAPHASILDHQSDVEQAPAGESTEVSPPPRTRDPGGDAWRGIRRRPATDGERADEPKFSGMVGEVPAAPEPQFLELDPAGTAYSQTPVGFAHVIRKYLTGDFFAQFIRLFIVCKMCQHRLESSGNLLACPGCKHRIDSKDLAVHVLRYVGEELYARERVTKDLDWLEAPKLNLRGTVKKNVGEDIARVLSEAYICMFAHELVKTAVHKSPGTLLEFFRKYIDRIEIGKGDIKIHIR